MMKLLKARKWKVYYLVVCRKAKDLCSTGADRREFAKKVVGT